MNRIQSSFPWLQNHRKLPDEKKKSKVSRLLSKTTNLFRDVRLTYRMRYLHLQTYETYEVPSSVQTLLNDRRKVSVTLIVPKRTAVHFLPTPETPFVQLGSGCIYDARGSENFSRRSSISRRIGPIRLRAQNRARTRGRL